MAVIDELIIRLGVEEDPTSRHILQSTINRLKRVETAAVSQGEKTAGGLERSGKAAQAAGKRLGTAGTIVGKLVDRLKSLGVVSGVASGVMAAWGVSAGREATRLANLSQAAQVSAKDIQTLGSVYERMGGKAESFARDAAAYFNQYGKSLDTDALKELSTLFATLPPNLAQQMGQAYGFSDDMIRVLRQGPDEIEAMAKRAKDLGHVLDNDNIVAPEKVYSGGVCPPVGDDQTVRRR